MQQRRILGSAVVLYLLMLVALTPLFGGTEAESGFTLRLSPPEISLTAHPDGSRSIVMPGYPVRQVRPGAPQIPTRMVRVAIPAGVDPILVVRPGTRRLMAGVLPRSVPFLEHSVATDGQVLGRKQMRPNRSIYHGARPFPEQVAWLGEYGILRNQRYVELFLAPVRFDPAMGGLEIYPDLEVELLFDSSAGPVSFDTVFEDLYRNAFVNYSQGLTFRLDSEDVAVAPVAAISTLDALIGSRYRILVRDYGLILLDHTLMSGTGLIAQPLSTWSVISQGVQVPIHIYDENGNDLMDSGDWVHFYAQPLDEDPKTRLNQDYADPAVDLFEAADFTDENTYFVGVESGPVSRMATRDGAPTFTHTPPADFQDTARKELDQAWRPLGGADPWYWYPTLNSADIISSRTVSEEIPLPGLAGPLNPVTVRVNVRGVSENLDLSPDHNTRVTLKNSVPDTLAVDDVTFDGRILNLHEFTWTWPGSGSGATNPLTVETEILQIASGDHTVIRDWIEVDYSRSFEAENDRLEFSWPDEDAEFEIAGFSLPPEAVYELTARVGSSKIFDTVRITDVAVTGSTGAWTVRFRVDNDPEVPDGEPRRFIAIGGAGVSIPSGADFTADTESDLRNNANQADLIVITHPDVAGTGSQLQSLLDFRLAEQGISSRIAWIEDVNDEFNTGLPGPDSIRNFLAYVMSTAPGEGWADPKPQYVLLLGDGSYDYKGGVSSKSFVPTQIMFKDDPSLGYYTSDSMLAAVVGDDHLADLVVGRISAGDIPTANVIIDKILAYGQSPPLGNWRNHALFMSDQGHGNDELEALAFEAINDQGLSFINIPPYTSLNLRYWSDFGNGTQPAAMNQAIKDAVNGTDGFSDGAVVAQFTGHGNFVVWSDDAFFDERYPASLDTDDLVNGYRLPWLINHSCLTGGFHTLLENSMGEDWMKRSGGGAMAVYAPSGLGFRYIGEVVTDRMFGDLFGPTKQRQVGLTVMNVQVDLCGQGSIEACQHYILLGDPTTRLVLPDIDRPTTLTASAGHEQVDLSWVASNTSGVTYDVYRTENLLNGYTKVVDSHPETFYTDIDLTNTRTYYYYVLAKDAEGFESRWSNFNSDCDLSGPDCVAATPLNPDPPTPPTGVTVVDPETGGRLDVSWSPNLEGDIQSYEVHYGTEPGVYTEVRGAGNSTSAVLSDLINGETYFIAVTASNTSGLVSGLSAEASGIPNFIPGLRPPAFIDDLVLEKQGADLRITWTAVTTDIYGKDETVSHYEVYRDLTPDFIPSPFNLVGTEISPEFIDSGAMQFGEPDYHYLVRAVDAEGNSGGLGHQLPKGISSLTLAKSLTVPENLVLDWTAVTLTFDGDPTVVDHYDIYGSDTPFTRQDVEDSLVPLLRAVTGSTEELIPADQRLFYSVIAVDRLGQPSPF